MIKKIHRDYDHKLFALSDLFSEKKLNISYFDLTSAKLESTKYTLKREGIVPKLVETKKIMIPHYSSKYDEMVDLPVEQEHVVGSGIYQLKFKRKYQKRNE